MPWKVTYAIDNLDPNPVVKVFEEEWEAQDYLNAEVYLRVGHIVEHSPYPVSDVDYEVISEIEYSLAKIERV